MLRFATIEGARANGLGAVNGSLEVGKAADIVILAGDTLATMPMNNPVASIVYAAHPGMVRDVLVAGRFVKRDGKLVGVDLDRLWGLAEATDRRAFLDFLGNAVVGSEWVRQRTPDLADQDWTPTFTGVLLRKDLDLGLAAAREHEVPMPVVSMVHQLVQQAIGHGHGERDLLALYEIQAAAGLADHQPLAERQPPSLDEP
ncbi:NAD-binding protein [Solwaraspora sp. WMMA2056]|uniref:NAD-binding protein n=1 Tax=Solwaraspora sp. WMMA2056 TaxID=3015161 RepID=UPI00338FB9BA